MNLSIYHRFMETYSVLGAEYRVEVLQRFSQPNALWAIVSEDHGLMLACTHLHRILRLVSPVPVTSEIAEYARDISVDLITTSNICQAISHRSSCPFTL